MEIAGNPRRGAGLDIARAVNSPRPISRGDALQVIAGAMTMAPDYPDRQHAAGLRVRYELRLRGGPGYGPLAGYGRTGQWDQIVRGKIRAAGRKPWLGFTFGRLITSP